MKFYTTALEIFDKRFNLTLLQTVCLLKSRFDLMALLIFETT